MTTGVEIIEQTRGEIDVFVAGMGTTGTLMGISQEAQEHNPKIQVVGVEPPKGTRSRAEEYVGSLCAQDLRSRQA